MKKQNGWTMPVQQASYRGVRFDVLSVDDSFDRALMEHSYPFVNGADLEDMGLNPLHVKMQAVFYGEGYYTDFQRFLSVLQDQGADVLMHPIRGRLQDMICYAASFRHEADFVDYVALELSFKQATPMKPIFVFEHALLSKIDKLLNQIADFVDDALELWGTLMEWVAFVYNAKARLLSSWGALYGCYQQVRSLFDADKTRYAISPSVSKETLKTQSGQAVKELGEIIRAGLAQTANQASAVVDLSATQTSRPQNRGRGATGRSAGKIAPQNAAGLNLVAGFDEVLRTVNRILQIPEELVTGKNDNIERNRTSLKALTSALKIADIKEIESALHLICSAELAKVAVNIIEQYSDNLTANEIDYMTTQVRLNLVGTLNIARELQGREQNVNQNGVNQGRLSVSAPNTGVYTQAHIVAENTRNLAHSVTQLALSAINQKPPLIIRTVAISGTIQQVAHDIYGDYSRGAELLRLNPHIRYPNFIGRGEVINSYAK